MVDLLVSFNRHALSVCLKQLCHFLGYVINIYYLESAYHDEQNDGQSFKIQARITELWQFKARKVKILRQEDG